MDAGEAGHTLECNICHPKPIAQVYKHFMAPPSLWWDPDAPEPLSGETLALLDKSQTYRSTLDTFVERG